MKTLFTFFALIFFFQSNAQMKFHWRQYSGRSLTTIVNPDSAKTLVTGLNIPDIYGFELTVSNAFGVGKDSCTVLVLRGGTLDIKMDTSHQIAPPEITKLEIKMTARASDIFVQVKSPRQQSIKCTLYDIVGRPIAEIEMQIKKGINFISVPKPRAHGVYILRFSTYFDNITRQIFI